MTSFRISVTILAVIHAVFAGFTALVGAFANGGDVWQRLLVVLLHPLGATGLLLLVLRPRLATTKNPRHYRRWLFTFCQLSALCLALLFPASVGCLGCQAFFISPFRNIWIRPSLQKRCPPRSETRSGRR